MGDLSDVLPKKSATVGAIYKHWKTSGDGEKRRRYLGMSSIGIECERQLWYSFRHAVHEEFEGRMYRLFNRGHREEAVFAEELRAIGCEVQLDDGQGSQIGFSSVGGHFKGHMDAAVFGVPEAPKTWHVGEFKTHSSKSFAKLEKEGVQASKPQHYAQMQAYMRYSGMTRALYLAVNKDNDDLYAERVRYDAEFASKLEEKAERIVTSTSKPTRISDRRDFYGCTFCPAKSLCHGSMPGEPGVAIKTLSCRQCCHATPLLTPLLDEDGHWHCSKHDKLLSDAEQEATCPSLLLLPDFITFADPIDASEDWIEFKNHNDGSVWRHGTDHEAGHYAAHDLTNAPAPTTAPAGLLERYAEGRASTVFKGASSEFEQRWHQFFKASVPEPIATEEGDGFTACEFPGGYLGLFSAEAMELRCLNHPSCQLWRESTTPSYKIQ